MKKSKYQQYFHCFIVIVSVFWFSYQNMVAILISTVYREVRRLLEGKCLLEGGAYFNVDT